MDDFIILESAQGLGDVMFKTTDKGIATFLFRTSDAASAFIDKRKRTSEWRQRKMTGPEFLAWVKESNANGLTDLVINPTPESDDANQKVMPVRSFLLAFDLQHGS